MILDNKKKDLIQKNDCEVSSDDSTIEIMSSGDELIDITNDLDPSESSMHYITEVNGSASEIAQRYK